MNADFLFAIPIVVAAVLVVWWLASIDRKPKRSMMIIKFEPMNDVTAKELWHAHRLGYADGAIVELGKESDAAVAAIDLAGTVSRHFTFELYKP